MFTLLNLPYQQEALDPVISAQTLSFHHGKHLQAYVDNLNKLLPGSEYEGMSLEDIVKNAPAGAIFNNAGQILNHELYFKQFRAFSDAAHENTPPSKAFRPPESQPLTTPAASISAAVIRNGRAYRLIACPAASQRRPLRSQADAPRCEQAFPSAA